MQLSSTRSGSIRRPRKRIPLISGAKLTGRIHFYSANNTDASDDDDKARFGAFWIPYDDSSDGTLLPLRIGDSEKHGVATTEYANDVTEYHGIGFSTNTNEAAQWKYLHVDLSGIDLGNRSDAQAGGRVAFYVMSSVNTNYENDICFDKLKLISDDGTTSNSTVIDPSNYTGPIVGSGGSGTVNPTWESWKNTSVTYSGNPPQESYADNTFFDCELASDNKRWNYQKGGSPTSGSGPAGAAFNIETGSLSGNTTQDADGVAQGLYLIAEATGRGAGKYMVARTKSQWNLATGAEI